MAMKILTSSTYCEQRDITDKRTCQATKSK